MFNFTDDEAGDQVIPFAVVGSNVVVEDEEGLKVRGRKYPWGTVNIEDEQHSDFSRLRTFLLSRHMQDLKDITNSDFYERYRRQKLAAVTKEVSLLSLCDRRLI